MSGTALKPPGEIEAEVAHLLATVLEAKTNQGLILAYLAAAYLRGQEAAKEYSIAVDALGRPPDFDPKRDSIVRVEVHKLRRTLSEYYAGEGRDRKVKLGVAAGKYALVVEGEAGAKREPEPGVVETSGGGQESGSGKKRAVAVAVAGAVLLVASWLAFRSLGGVGPPPASTVAATSAPPVGAGVRILCGAPGTRAVDSSGQTWEGDRYFSGGRAIANVGARILNTPDQSLYQAYREGDFTYEIPLPPGHYEVRLHFAETTFGKDNPGGGGEASRMFQVSINGRLVLAPLDVILHAGGANLAVVKVFPGQRPDSDGMLRIRFESLRNDKAFVNAIEVLPGFRDRMLPLRIAAGAPAGVLDDQGRIWLSDRFVLGGRAQERTKPVAAGSPQLFRYERFGRFEYNLPATRGHRFLLRVWMAEQYFGVFSNPAAKSRRLFDIVVNNASGLRDLSVMDMAGGPLKAVERSIAHLSPDPQDNIRVLFTPKSNYAVVNALELLDEGPAFSGGR